MCAANCDLHCMNSMAKQEVDIHEQMTAGELHDVLMNCGADLITETLKDIQDGKFAKAWVREYKGGYKQYNKLLKAGEKHNIEKVGSRLRSMMPWMQKRTVKGAQAAY